MSQPFHTAPVATVGVGVQNRAFVHADVGAPPVAGGPLVSADINDMF